MRGVGSQFRWGLAVVAERAVAALDRGSHTLGLGGPDELERVGGAVCLGRRRGAALRLLLLRADESLPGRRHSVLVGCRT